MPVSNYPDGIVDDLEARGFVLYLDAAGVPRITPADRLTAADRELLTAHREPLVEYLRVRHGVRRGYPWES